jgi:hypothetical protein
MSDRWDDRDRAERDRGWSEGRDRWTGERQPDRDRESNRRSMMAGRNWDENRERERDSGWFDRDRDRGWGSGWGDNRDRWSADRDDRDWERRREAGRGVIVGRGGMSRDNYDEDRRRWEMRDREHREWRSDDRGSDREHWGRPEHFGDRDRDSANRRGADAPAFTGAGGTWSAGHSGAAGHEAAGSLSSWNGRDRDEDRDRRGSFAGRGPKNYRRADDRICEDANDRLTRHAAVDASDIEVTVKDGEITLTGMVASRGERRSAEDAVWEVWGVREVHNNLRVQSREDRGVLDKVADAFRGDNR